MRFLFCQVNTNTYTPTQASYQPAGQTPVSNADAWETGLGTRIIGNIKNDATDTTKKWDNTSFSASLKANYSTLSAEKIEEIANHFFPPADGARGGEISNADARQNGFASVTDAQEALDNWEGIKAGAPPREIKTLTDLKKAAESLGFTSAARLEDAIKRAAENSGREIDLAIKDIRGNLGMLVSNNTPDAKNLLTILQATDDEGRQDILSALAKNPVTDIGKFIECNAVSISANLARAGGTNSNSAIISSALQVVRQTPGGKLFDNLMATQLETFRSIHHREPAAAELLTIIKNTEINLSGENSRWTPADRESSAREMQALGFTAEQITQNVTAAKDALPKPPDEDTAKLLKDMGEAAVLNADAFDKVFGAGSGDALRGLAGDIDKTLKENGFPGLNSNTPAAFTPNPQPGISVDTPPPYGVYSSEPERRRRSNQEFNAELTAQAEASRQAAREIDRRIESLQSALTVLENIDLSSLPEEKQEIAAQFLTFAADQLRTEIRETVALLNETAVILQEAASPVLEKKDIARLRDRLAPDNRADITRPRPNLNARLLASLEHRITATVSGLAERYLTAQVSAGKVAAFSSDFYIAVQFFNTLEAIALIETVQERAEQRQEEESRISANRVINSWFAGLKDILQAEVTSGSRMYPNQLATMIYGFERYLERLPAADTDELAENIGQNLSLIELDYLAKSGALSSGMLYIKINTELETRKAEIPQMNLAELTENLRQSNLSFGLKNALINALAGKLTGIGDPQKIKTILETLPPDVQGLVLARLPEEIQDALEDSGQQAAAAR